jgi:hypothetical protein
MRIHDEGRVRLAMRGTTTTTETPAGWKGGMTRGLIAFGAMAATAGALVVGVTYLERRRR